MSIFLEVWAVFFSPAENKAQLTQIRMDYKTSSQ